MLKYLIIFPLIATAAHMEYEISPVMTFTADGKMVPIKGAPLPVVFGLLAPFAVQENPKGKLECDVWAHKVPSTHLMLSGKMIVKKYQSIVEEK